MLEIPRSFMSRVRPRSGGGNPTEIHTKFRFFNESNDTADAEAYGSQMGMGYEPVGVIPSSPPQSAMMTYQQFPPINDPRHFMVILHRNAEPLGPFYFAFPTDNVTVLEVALYVDPATQFATVEIGGKDGGGAPIPPIVFG